MRKTALLAATFLLAAPVAAQGPAGLDPAALEELHAAAARAGSDAVLLERDGEVVAEWYFDQERGPIEVMSVLKSLVAVAVGRLLELGHIESIDQPVHEIYPEWRQGAKRDVTIRHLLNHTSGIQNVPNAGEEIYPSPDAVRLALAAELTDAPGETFAYNNKATNLLSGIIQEASGMRMDQFFTRELFAPMGIDRYQWHYDASGAPHAMAGLRLHSRDLAKFGRLVLDGGTWDGERLVGEAFLTEMLEQGQPHYARHGLLWWRLPRPAGVDSAAADGPEAEPEIVAYYGDGYLGQTLMIVPEHDLVAVRQVRGDDVYDGETDVFQEFKELVLRVLER